MNSSFISFSTLLRVVPKLKQKRFPFLYTMDGVHSYPLLAVWNPARHHVHKFQSKAVFKKDRCLVSVAILRPGTDVMLGKALHRHFLRKGVRERGWVIHNDVFSHNEAKAKCILSRRLIMTLRTTRSVTRSGMSITQVTVLMDCCPLILKLVTDRDRHTHSKPRFPAPSSKEEGCCKPELGVSFANRRTGARTGTGTHIHPVLGISFTNTRTGARTGTGTHIHMHFTHNNLTLTIMCLLN